tara:strand:- start:269 stop:1228 length:960 start_codon:yes stop_codon:yes gene_type:complete
MSQFSELISFIRKEINYSIKKLPIPDTPSYLYKPIKYALKGGGKRLRPILTHLVGRAYNIDPNSLMSISLAIELLHNFTLIHDDIMDRDTIRHSQKTVHHKWDISTAILAGDGVYTISQLVLNSIDRHDKKINKCFNEVTLDICEGQAMDKEFENLDIVTEDLYLEMVKKKTGSLIAAAAILPSIYAGDEIENIELFRIFGECLGKGFQIQDDLLEITSDSKTMGKSLDSDIFEGKQTIMVIKAKQYFKESWDSIILNSKKSDLKKNIYTFFDEKKIIEETKHIAESYFKKSRKILKKLNHINADELFMFVDLLENRSF